MTGMPSRVVCVDCFITSEAICMTGIVMSFASLHSYFSHSEHMSSMKRCGYIFCLDQCGTAVRILTVLWL